MNSEASEGGAGGIVAARRVGEVVLGIGDGAGTAVLGADELLGGEKALERTNYERSRERHTQVGWEH